MSYCIFIVEIYRKWIYKELLEEKKIRFIWEERAGKKKVAKKSNCSRLFFLIVFSHFIEDVCIYFPCRIEVSTR